MNPLPDNNTEIESTDTESTNLVEEINYNEESVDQLLSFAQDIISGDDILLATKEMEALRWLFTKNKPRKARYLTDFFEKRRIGR